MLAPSVHAMFDSVLDPSERLYQRLFTASHGSMLSPGVGTLALIAPPRPRRVTAGSPLASPTRFPSSCKLSAIGIRLPPITRNAPCPPMDEKLSLMSLGFHDAIAAVSVIAPKPKLPRAPYA